MLMTMLSKKSLQYLDVRGETWSIFEVLFHAKLPLPVLVPGTKEETFELKKVLSFSELGADLKKWESLVGRAD